MRKKVLVVDDERGMLQVLRRCLERGGYAAIAAENASDGLLLARTAGPDLILSDADMPGLDGHSFCRAVKSDPALGRTPFLLMSGRRTGEADILSGYGGGADDYLLKPFSLPVMLAKVGTAIRNRAAAAGEKAPPPVKGLEIDEEGRTVKVNGRRVELTRKEFDLLALLAGKAGRVLGVGFLLENVWGYDLSRYNDPHTVEVHVSQLRRKLGKPLAARLVTVTGYGYKFEA